MVLFAVSELIVSYYSPYLLANTSPYLCFSAVQNEWMGWKKNPERHWVYRERQPDATWGHSQTNQSPPTLLCLCPCYTSSSAPQSKKRCAVTDSAWSLLGLSKPGSRPMIFTTYLHSEPTIAMGTEVLCKLWKGKEGIKWYKLTTWNIKDWRETRESLVGGNMGGKSHVIAPLADSRGNRMATQSLTQLIIINQAQHLTYAPLPFNPHSLAPHHFPLLISLILSLLFFPLTVSREQQEIQDEVIDYIPHCSSVNTHRWSPVLNLGTPQPLRCWESCDDNDEWKCGVQFCSYLNQTASAHTQQSSRPLPIRAEGLCLLAPYIRKDTMNSWQLQSKATSGVFFFLLPSWCLPMWRGTSNLHIQERSTKITSGPIGTALPQVDFQVLSLLFRGALGKIRHPIAQHTLVVRGWNALHTWK